MESELVCGHERNIGGNVVFGSILLSKRQSQSKLCMMRRRKGKKEYKVSGNRNPLHRSSGASQRKCGYGMKRPNHAEKLYRLRDDSGEEVRKGCREAEKSSEWTLEKIHEAYEKLAKEEIGRLGFCAGNLEEKYGLFEEDHCASRWKERSHFAVNLPALQQFRLGGLHLVGFDPTQ